MVSKKGVKKRAARATSNVFAMFDQAEIQVGQYDAITSLCSFYCHSVYNFKSYSFADLLFTLSSVLCF